MKSLFISMSLSMVASLAASSAVAFSDVRYEGVPVAERITRGEKSVDGTFRADKELTTRIDRIYSRKVWSYEEVPAVACRMIPGRGDGDWKGFWQASSVEEKIAHLSNAIKGLGEAGAAQIVQDGYLRTRPLSWNEFRAEILRADNQPDSLGYAREVLENHGETNRRNLGYIDREPQASGGGEWQGYWDASYRERPRRLAQAVRGLTLEGATAIVNGGFMDHLPRNWRNFADRILDADRRFEMGFSNEVLVRFGRENMRLLGYFDEQGCSLSMNRTQVMKIEQVREYDRSAQRALSLEVTGAPLLKGEAETFTFGFDGFADALTVQSRFNRYEQKRTEDSSGGVVYQLKGERILGRPANSVETAVLNESGVFSFVLVDRGFDPDFGVSLGELVVKVEIYETKFFADKKLGTYEVKVPAGGAEMKVTTNIRPPSGKKAYAYYQIRRIGSRFHTAESSDWLYSEKVRF